MKKKFTEKNSFPNGKCYMLCEMWFINMYILKTLLINRRNDEVNVTKNIKLLLSIPQGFAECNDLPLHAYINYLVS